MGNIPCCEEERQNKQSQIRPLPSTKNNENIENTPSQHRDSKSQSSHHHVKRRGPDNYQSKKYLGRGAFGCVVLTQEKESGQLYAMKIIQKQKIKEFNLLQCQLIKRLGKQQFLANICETFQNQTRIYIIMEYLPMGDLYFYLKKKEIPFTEEMVKGIIAEIVVGVSILHKHGIIYRQLKPQNLLITNEGHIKLTDYGLSKIILSQQQSISTFVGTLQYMPPEALDGNFGKKADIWSLGVLMYELMFRENIFDNNDSNSDFDLHGYKNVIQANIIAEKINSKIGYMSSGFRDLLIRLLQKNPQKRISLEQIRQHDFFKSLDWKEVEQRKNTPPLNQIILKNDYITFRDATNEEYIRKEIAKHKHDISYELKLFEFRKSQ